MKWLKFSGSNFNFIRKYNHKINIFYNILIYFWIITIISCSNMKMGQNMNYTKLKEKFSANFKKDLRLSKINNKEIPGNIINHLEDQVFDTTESINGDLEDLNDSIIKEKIDEELENEKDKDKDKEAISGIILGIFRKSFKEFCEEEAKDIYEELLKENLFSDYNIKKKLGERGLEDGKEGIEKILKYSQKKEKDILIKEKQKIFVENNITLLQNFLRPGINGFPELTEYFNWKGIYDAVSGSNLKELKNQDVTIGRYQEDPVYKIFLDNIIVENHEMEVIVMDFVRRLMRLSPKKEKLFLENLFRVMTATFFDLTRDSTPERAKLYDLYEKYIRWSFGNSLPNNFLNKRYSQSGELGSSSIFGCVFGINSNSKKLILEEFKILEEFSRWCCKQKNGGVEILKDYFQYLDPTKFKHNEYWRENKGNGNKILDEEEMVEAEQEIKDPQLSGKYWTEKNYKQVAELLYRKDKPPFFSQAIMCLLYISSSKLDGFRKNESYYIDNENHKSFYDIFDVFDREDIYKLREALKENNEISRKISDKTRKKVNKLLINTQLTDISKNKIKQIFAQDTLPDEVYFYLNQSKSEQLYSEKFIKTIKDIDRKQEDYRIRNTSNIAHHGSNKCKDGLGLTEDVNDLLYYCNDLTVAYLLKPPLKYLIDLVEFLNPDKSKKFINTIYNDWMNKSSIDPERLKWLNLNDKRHYISPLVYKKIKNDKDSVKVKHAVTGSFIKMINLFLENNGGAKLEKKRVGDSTKRVDRVDLYEILFGNKFKQKKVTQNIMESLYPKNEGNNFILWELYTSYAQYLKYISKFNEGSIDSDYKDMIIEFIIRKLVYRHLIPYLKFTKHSTFPYTGTCSADKQPRCLDDEYIISKLKELFFNNSPKSVLYGPLGPKTLKIFSFFGKKYRYKEDGYKIEEEEEEKENNNLELECDFGSESCLPDFINKIITNEKGILKLIHNKFNELAIFRQFSRFHKKLLTEKKGVYCDYNNIGISYEDVSKILCKTNFEEKKYEEILYGGKYPTSDDFRKKKKSLIKKYKLKKKYKSLMNEYKLKKKYKLLMNKYEELYNNCIDYDSDDSDFWYEGLDEVPFHEEYDKYVSDILKKYPKGKVLEMYVHSVASYQKPFFKEMKYKWPLFLTYKKLKKYYDECIMNNKQPDTAIFQRLYDEFNTNPLDYEQYEIYGKLSMIFYLTHSYVDEKKHESIPLLLKNHNIYTGLDFYSVGSEKRLVSRIYFSKMRYGPYHPDFGFDLIPKNKLNNNNGYQDEGLDYGPNVIPSPGGPKNKLNNNNVNQNDNPYYGPNVIPSPGGPKNKLNNNEEDDLYYGNNLADTPKERKPRNNRNYNKRRNYLKYTIG